MRVDEILGRLDGWKRNASGWEARCPAHEDRKASLGIAEGDDGRTLLTCRAGCSTESVVAALGLELKDLYVEEVKPQEVIETTYDYVDEQGALLYQVVRFRPKRFQQRKPDGAGGWEWKLGDVRRVLYRLPELLASTKPIWIVEGEKDVEALREHGVNATTNVGGAQAWKDEYSDLIAGKAGPGATVVVVADRDGPGIKRAQKIAAELEQRGLQAIVVQAKEGKDAYDHLAAGFGPQDFERLDENKPADGIILERFSKIEATQPEWVIGLEGFVPFKAITLLAGEQGTNKSTFACYLAALITTTYSSDVFYITTEGDPGVEIKPRLLAAGADVDRCHFVRRAVDGFEGIVSFPNDIRDLEAAVKKTGARLIVIDPVLAHVDVEDTNNDNSIRTALAPLQQMAQRNNLIVLLIAHINKDKSTDPFKRVGGSKGLTGVARSNLMMGKMAKDGEEGLRAIASFKSSWADPTSALQFRVTSEYVPEIEGYSIRALPFGTTRVKAHHLLAENRGQRD